MTCSCLPHAAALQTSGQTSAPSDISMHLPLLFFLPPVISVSEGERFVFPTCACSSQIQGERFPPPTSLNLKPTRAPRPRCCLNFTLRLDFHPFRAGLVYTGCGVREITVCVCASAGLGFLEPPQANLKLTAWKIRLPFGPFVSCYWGRAGR